MTDLRDYLHYFQQLANEHKEINDFYIMDLNEPLVAMRGHIQYPAMILSSLAGNIKAANLDNTIDNIRGGFLIVGHLAHLDDFEAEMLLLQDMKQIATDIISRMLHDVWKCETLAVKALPGFDLNTVQYEQIDGVFENGFGYLVNFQLMDTIDLRLDASKWDATRTIQGKDIY